MCRNGICGRAFGGGEGTGCGRHCGNLQTEAFSNEGAEAAKDQRVNGTTYRAQEQRNRVTPSRTEAQPKNGERKDEPNQGERDRLPADHLPSRYFLRTKYFKYWDFWDHFR
ncbi:hypothetical protein SAMN02799616_01302 [Paenibacillus sp. UNC499MF]|nr:hypothetical protein SAMN02799616_01302 [Paenibacillus sp. UNC499MF]